MSGLQTRPSAAAEKPQRSCVSNRQTDSRDDSPLVVVLQNDESLSVFRRPL